ncbi:MAG: hypothetical protein ACLU4J_24960 [Butyricimonas paravirosa]
MNIFNVHINRFPINGIIKFSNITKEDTLAAYRPRFHGKQKEQPLLSRQPTDKEIVMRQIAGPWLNVLFHTLRSGESPPERTYRIHQIRFPGRLVPTVRTKIDVKLGQKVTGSQTLIGTFQEPESK